MALHIEDAEIDSLAHELARLERVPVTGAVRQALKERLAAKARERERKRRLIQEVQRELRELPVLDDRPLEAMLYDQRGEPT